MGSRVSIPFKRESISKESLVNSGFLKACVVSIPFKRESISKEYLLVLAVEGRLSVSIPFKRESISKVPMWVSVSRRRNIVFQFPSNGKAYPKERLPQTLASSFSLSFNSLQTGKAYPKLSRQEHIYVDFEFQFPSNGKAYPKGSRSREGTAADSVSIPFKRESISKVATVEKALRAAESFNSLQTGKHIQRKAQIAKVAAELTEFQFPSNGESISKGGDVFCVAVGCYVSIPFKRESISKGISVSQ